MVFTRMGLKPREGSSSMRMVGWLIMARPIASICCSPPLKEPAFWFCRDLSTGKRSKAFVQGLAEDGARPRRIGARASGSRGRSGSQRASVLRARGRCLCSTTSWGLRAVMDFAGEEYLPLFRAVYARRSSSAASTCRHRLPPRGKRWFPVSTRSDTSHKA